MRKFLAAAAIAATVLTGCGGGSSGSAVSKIDTSKLSGDDKAAFEAINGKLAEDEGGISEGVSEDQQACVAVGMIKQLGAKRVLQLSKDDELVLEKAEAEKTADVFLGCVDVGALMASSISEDGSISEKSAKCLAGKIDTKVIRTALINEFTGNGDSNDDMPPEFLEAMLKGMTQCLTKEELAEMGQN